MFSCLSFLFVSLPALFHFALSLTLLLVKYIYLFSVSHLSLQRATEAERKHDTLQSLMLLNNEASSSSPTSALLGAAGSVNATASAKVHKILERDEWQSILAPTVGDHFIFLHVNRITKQTLKSSSFCTKLRVKMCVWGQGWIPTHPDLRYRLFAIPFGGDPSLVAQVFRDLLAVRAEKEAQAKQHQAQMEQLQLIVHQVW
jgi:hypothetical protein